MNLARHYRVTAGKGFRIAHVDPADSRGLADASAVQALRDHNRDALAELQQRLYAGRRWSLLLIFQALDAGGKDGTIRDVLSDINPQGCVVTPFKVPSDDELDHDFLWRYLGCLPLRGQIGAFNRSYYEDVIVPRIHPEVLGLQRVPDALLGKHLWSDRLRDIREVEQYLTRNGVVIRKFFLHISKDEQRKRLLARLDDPSKNWKFAYEDIDKRKLFGKYLRCYEETIRATATPQAPWYVIPADHKWFARAVVSEVIVQALDELKLEYPRVDKKLAARAREALHPK